MSWRYVEQPFRRRAAAPLIGRPGVFAASAAGGLAFVAFGLWGDLGDGLPQRTSPNGIAFSSVADDGRLSPNYGLHEECEGNSTLSPPCTTSAEPQVILWGDSYAMHLAQALISSPDAPSLAQLTKSQCAPIAGIGVTGSVTSWDECIAFNDRALETIRDSESARFVVMSSPFTIGMGRVYLRDGTPVDEEQVGVLVESILETVRLLRSYGKTPIIVSPTPRSGVDIGQCLIKAVLFESPFESCDFHKADYSEQTIYALGLLSSVAEDVPVYWLDAIMCPQGVCRASAAGVFLYRDSGHLSFEGARYLGSHHDLWGQVHEAARQGA